MAVVKQVRDQVDAAVFEHTIDLSDVAYDILKISSVDQNARYLSVRIVNDHAYYTFNGSAWAWMTDNCAGKWSRPVWGLNSPISRRISMTFELEDDALAFTMKWL
jgi:hypothetical protein